MVSLPLTRPLQNEYKNRVGYAEDTPTVYKVVHHGFFLWSYHDSINESPPLNPLTVMPLVFQ